MRFFSLATLALILALAGCSDVISPVGDAILPPQDGITVDSLELTAVSSSTYRQRIIGVSTTLLLGRSDDLEARIPLRFTGIPTNKQNAVIDSAILRLRINYRFRDSIGTLALEARRILRSWTEATCTWDTLTSTGTVSTVIDTTALFPITPQDTVLAIRIDPIVRAWFSEGSASPNGFVLQPSLGSTIVAGISTYSDGTTDYRPRLEISYRDTADTVTLKLLPAARSSVSDGVYPVVPGEEVVQGGISYRMKVAFDISRLPASASITSAKLSLSMDTLASLSNVFTRNQLLVHYATENAANPRLSTLSHGANPADSIRKAFAAEVRQTIQFWHTGTANNGFVIRASAESQTFDRYALFGAASADSLLRPRLKIIYSILP